MDPIWSANGRELLYWSFTSDGQQLFFVRRRQLGGAISNSSAEDDVSGEDGRVQRGARAQLDVSADRKRFLLVKPSPSTDEPVSTIQVVLNWSEELNRRVPVN
jgi:hypothetical protein